MGSLSIPLAANATLSSIAKCNPFFFTKIDQIPESRKGNSRRFRVACRAEDNKEQNGSTCRRNVLMGLGGLYGAAGIPHDPFSLAAPVPDPNFDLCNPSIFPGISRSPPSVKCCPPKPANGEIIDFLFPEPPLELRVRQAAHLVNDGKYKEAVRRMKQLDEEDPSDPRGFRQQANVHCAYCEGGYQQTGFDVEYQVHSNWLFFPFHRLYLYFYERICQELLQDPTFALPFWNYDGEPDGMNVPPMFAAAGSPLHDPLRNPKHQPYKIDLNYPSDGNVPQEKQVSLNYGTMYREVVTQVRNPCEFFGSSYVAGKNSGESSGSCTVGGGSIERGFHTAVHRWTGTDPKDEKGKLNGRGENMGIFYAAARDPIFYAHHANVDRMWSIWKNLDQEKNQDISDPDWLKTSFLFYDEKKRLVRVRVEQCLETKNLGYTYQDDVKIPWLEKTPKPAASPAPGFLYSFAKSIVRGNEVPTSEAIYPVKLDKLVKVLVERPGSDELEKDEILEIRNIKIGDEDFVKFDVLINDFFKTITPENTEFAGSFSKISHTMINDDGSRSSMGGKERLTLPLTPILKDIGAGDDKLVQVTLVPRSGCDNVTIGGIKITLR